MKSRHRSRLGILLFSLVGMCAWPRLGYSQESGPAEDLPVAGSEDGKKPGNGSGENKGGASLQTRDGQFKARVEQVEQLAVAFVLDCAAPNSPVSAICTKLCNPNGIDFCSLGNNRSLTVTAVAAANDSLAAIEVRLKKAYEAAREPEVKALAEAKESERSAQADLDEAKRALASATTRANEKEAKEAKKAIADATAKLTKAKAAVASAEGVLAAHDDGLAYSRLTQPIRADKLDAAPGFLAADLGGLALRFAVGLGKLALDRAKQEGVIWAIDQINRNICSPPDPAKAPVTNELATYWFTNTCNYVRADVVDQSYGAGNDMLAHLVAALEKDLRRAPGSAAGLLLAFGFWAEGCNAKAMFDCPIADNAQCERADKLRVAAANAVEGVIDGRDPLEQLEHFAATFDDINRIEQEPSKKFGDQFHAPRMQIGICAASVAAALGANDKQILIPWQLYGHDGVGEIELVVAALVDSAPCWSLVGEGYVWDNWDKPKLTAARDRDIERLSSVIRIHTILVENRTKFSAFWREFEKSVDRFNRLKGQYGSDVLDDLFDGEANTEAQLAVLVWKLDLAALGVETAELFVELLEQSPELSGGAVGLFPGLWPSGTSEYPANGWNTIRFDDIRAGLERASTVIGAVRAVTERDWPTASVEILALLRDTKPMVPSGSVSNVEIADELARYIGLFVAVLEAKDSDDMAKVLANTAAPPGAWRRKQVPNSFTLSLASHVGFIGGAELRKGQYGVHYEAANRVYSQLPTLSLPIGFDFAWGNRREHKRPTSNGFFISLIDPAAFLQYDIDEGGRLPGPRPLTIFSLGALYRLGLPRSPFTVLLGYIYRPRLRTWQPTVNEPGADAHQFVLSVAVDATIWNIVKR